jgi:hypothetical protein
MEEEGRIAANRFPEDWKYFTLTLPVGRYKHLTQDEILKEMDSCIHRFYSLRGILRRVVRNLWKRQHPYLTLASNLSYRKNGSISRDVCQDFKNAGDRLKSLLPMPATGDNLHVLVPRLNIQKSNQK